LTSNATRDNPGTTSLNSSSRLPIRSLAEFDKPVTFASGRAKLFTSLLPKGSGTTAKTTGIVVVASLAYGAALAPTLTKTSTPDATSSKLVWLLVGKAMFQYDASTFDVAEVSKTLHQRPEI
jgi:hypothetical protein